MARKFGGGGSIELMATKRSPTTKDIGLLKQLHDQGQLALTTEFQRNSVWPSAAKAYLIDTILNDRPIPLLFLQRVSSAQTGRPGYAVIDGQQRLRAIFDFIDDRFRLTQSNKKAPYYKKKYSELVQRYQDAIHAYDLPVQELTGYTDDDIKDVFVRMNRYVVKLSPQELRHAKGSGKFSEFVERIGKWDFWKTHRIITAQQRKRMRSVEFAAELTILLIEGPQDKKSAIELYYGQYRDRFPDGHRIESRLKMFMSWLDSALPDLATTRFRSPTDLYSLVGALNEITGAAAKVRVEPSAAGRHLRQFSEKTRQAEPTGDAARYLVAASRQTDNVQPRTTRIEIIKKLLSKK
jgi:hypothetical protein